ncbi:NAD(P)H-dependent oxidoreductase [Clostridium sp. MSJ-11]|uniref:NAD(P)H-dependent oxidoreductase n=1 Tax=Clostridium mobile TaxID=2841512 RepID=A0ABS6EIK3_9CLOT|nr:NAD(P)H-dependent oxidoreductase [Clostridium mobile]MBU5484597.1 NAD(P)H-dependent oxidoreductase [Clostridium mobile]
MKILAIMGCSKNGNTSDIIKYFENQINKNGDVDFEYLYLSDYTIDFCTGCHNCIFIGEDKCREYKNVKAIEDKILSSDGIILASPGYMFSVTGIMKNFLDHVAYNCHRPKYFGKKAYIISSCTKWQEKGVFIPMETWVSAAGFNFVGKTYVDMLPLPMSQKEMDKKRKKIDKASYEFYTALNRKEQLKPKFSHLMVFHSFRTLCEMAPNVLKADYEYFKERNAYDKNTKWYVPANISFIKHNIACKMEGKMVKVIEKLIDKEKISVTNGRYKNEL